MVSKEEKVTLFKSIGLGDVKIEETLKNESLSNFLCEIINSVGFILIIWKFSNKFYKLKIKRVKSF